MFLHNRNISIVDTHNENIVIDRMFVGSMHKVYPRNGLIIEIGLNEKTGDTDFEFSATVEEALDRTDVESAFVTQKLISVNWSETGEAFNTITPSERDEIMFKIGETLAHFGDLVITRA